MDIFKSQNFKMFNVNESCCAHNYIAKDYCLHQLPAVRNCRKNESENALCIPSMNVKTLWFQFNGFDIYIYTHNTQAIHMKYVRSCTCLCMHHLSDSMINNEIVERCDGVIILAFCFRNFQFIRLKLPARKYCHDCYYSIYNTYRIVWHVHNILCS